VSSAILALARIIFFVLFSDGGGEMMAKTVIVAIKVRMPLALRKALDRDAEKNGLTVNGEILRRLEASYSELTSLADMMESLRRLERRFASFGNKPKDENQ
jgi:Arc-like DNA binding domain